MLDNVVLVVASCVEQRVREHGRSLAIQKPLGQNPFGVNRFGDTANGIVIPCEHGRIE
jgi:hypothetical protein